MQQSVRLFRKKLPTLLLAVVPHLSAEACSSVRYPAVPHSETHPSQLPASITCGASMAAIGATRFLEGDNRFDSDIAEHWVSLSAFCIDRYEVTVADYHLCVIAGSCSESGPENTAGAPGWDELCNRADAGRDDHPINCVDWQQSDEFCKWKGKRLPTEAEWEYAARGSDGRVYPWGNSPPDSSSANLCNTECAEFLHAHRLLDIAPLTHQSDGWATTSPGGSFPADVSSFGVFDLAGNVSEWTADWYQTYSAEPITNPNGPQTGDFRVQRGGNWYSRVEEGANSVIRYPNEPQTRGVDRGFRCASDRDRD